MVEPTLNPSPSKQLIGNDELQLRQLVGQAEEFVLQLQHTLDTKVMSDEKYEEVEAELEAQE